MAKIRSLQDILAIREQAQKKTALREDGYKMCFTVHMGTCGIASGARDVVNAMAEELEGSGRTDIRLTTSGCIGACEHEPVMTVETLGAQPVLYGHLDAKKAREVFRQTLAGKSAAAYVVYVGSEPSDIGRGKSAEYRGGAKGGKA
ncbi:MAG: (2Fe-2S) ferredoxin domain-containing protein [Spirochaetia bacterium]|jgi:NADP-reducing hydrogenase subunit HndB